MYKTDKTVEQHLRESFSYKRPLREVGLLKNIKSRSLFGCVQCVFEVPENLREALANFPPIIRKIIVGRDDLGPLMKEYAEKERLLTQPSRMLLSSFLAEWNNRCCSFAWIWGWFAGKLIVLCNTLR